MEQGKIQVPVWEKAALSVEEAVAYSGIGETNLRRALAMPSCPFAFKIGTKTLVKRKELVEYISRHNALYVTIHGLTDSGM